MRKTIEVSCECLFNDDKVFSLIVDRELWENYKEDEVLFTPYIIDDLDYIDDYSFTTYENLEEFLKDDESDINEHIARYDELWEVEEKEISGMDDALAVSFTVPFNLEELRAL